MGDNMLIKEMKIEERPREKLLELGSNNLSDEELLAIIIKTGTKGYSSKDLAISLIENLGGINNLKDLTINSLDSIKGIGKVKKIELLAILELGKRIYLKRNIIHKKYTDPYLIYLDNKSLIYGLKQEYFYVFYLDTKKNLIERKLLYMGTINKSVVHPREVFKYAYILSASGLICMHNHPTGDVIPSKSDIDLTKTLVEIGRIQGIEVLDHLVVSDENYFSFYENHLIGDKV